jgi:hypothetical protein
MSKYCVGMLLLERPVKHNAFKEVCSEAGQRSAIAA